MKTLTLIPLLFLSLGLRAQKLPHGMVYGKKPARISVIQADKLEAYMGKRTRIRTAVAGRVTLVTKAKGGWFDMDAGNGRIITAHFTKAGITLPTALKNRYIVMEGVAQKQFVADDKQHFAGDRQTGGIGHATRQNPKQLLMFEVNGLQIDK